MSPRPMPLAADRDDPLGCAIERRDWESALTEIDRRLALAGTAERRAFYHHFRGRMFKWMLRDNCGRAAGEEGRARTGELAVEAFEAACAEDPGDVSHRLALAELHLRYLGRTEATGPLLAPFAAPDRDPRGDLAWQDHRRLTLGALALAMEGRTEQSVAAFLVAYGADQPGRIRSPYKIPLWILVRRGILLSAGQAGAITGGLARFPAQNPAALDTLRRRLCGE